jgi:hypothetical protein
MLHDLDVAGLGVCWGRRHEHVGQFRVWSSDSTDLPGHSPRHGLD